MRRWGFGSRRSRDRAEERGCSTQLKEKSKIERKREPVASIHKNHGRGKCRLKKRAREGVNSRKRENERGPRFRDKNPKPGSFMGEENKEGKPREREEKKGRTEGKRERVSKTNSTGHFQSGPLR